MNFQLLLLSKCLEYNKLVELAKNSLWLTLTTILFYLEIEERKPLLFYIHPVSHAPSSWGTAEIIRHWISQSNPNALLCVFEKSLQLAWIIDWWNVFLYNIEAELRKNKTHKRNTAFAFIFYVFPGGCLWGNLSNSKGLNCCLVQRLLQEPLSVSRG